MGLNQAEVCAALLMARKSIAYERRGHLRQMFYK